MATFTVRASRTADQKQRVLTVVKSRTTPESSYSDRLRARFQQTRIRAATQYVDPKKFVFRSPVDPGQEDIVQAGYSINSPEYKGRGTLYSSTLPHLKTPFLDLVSGKRFNFAAETAPQSKIGGKIGMSKLRTFLVNWFLHSCSQEGLLGPLNSKSYQHRLVPGDNALLTNVPNELMEEAFKITPGANGGYRVFVPIASHADSGSDDRKRDIINKIFNPASFALGESKIEFHENTFNGEPSDDEPLVSKRDIPPAYDTDLSVVQYPSKMTKGMVFVDEGKSTKKEPRFNKDAVEYIKKGNPSFRIEYIGNVVVVYFCMDMTLREATYFVGGNPTDAQQIGHVYTALGSWIAGKTTEVRTAKKPLITSYASLSKAAHTPFTIPMSRIAADRQYQYAKTAIDDSGNRVVENPEAEARTDKNGLCQTRDGTLWYIPGKGEDPDLQGNAPKDLNQTKDYEDTVYNALLRRGLDEEGPTNIAQARSLALIKHYKDIAASGEKSSGKNLPTHYKNAGVLIDWYSNKLSYTSANRAEGIFKLNVYDLKGTTPGTKYLYIKHLHSRLSHPHNIAALRTIDELAKLYGMPILHPTPGDNYGNIIATYVDGDSRTGKRSPVIRSFGFDPKGTAPLVTLALLASPKVRRLAGKAEFDNTIGRHDTAEDSMEDLDVSEALMEENKTQIGTHIIPDPMCKSLMDVILKLLPEVKNNPGIAEANIDYQSVLKAIAIMTLLRDAGKIDPNSGSLNFFNMLKESDAETSTYRSLHPNPDADIKPISLLAQGRKLQHHQVKIHSLLSQNPPPVDAIISSHPGGGKTIQIILDILHHMTTGNLGPYIVVCPQNLVADYVNEILYATDSKVNPVAITTKNYEKWQLEHNGKFDGLMRKAPVNTIFVVGIRTLTTKRYNAGYGNSSVTVLPIVNMLRSFRPSYVAVDEAHQLKSYGGQNREAVELLMAGVQYRRLATGTLGDNTIMDIASIVSILNPSIFGSPEQFMLDYMDPSSNPPAPKPNAELALKSTLFSNLALCVANRKEWARILPPAIRRYHYIDMTPMQRLLHDILLQSTSNSSITTYQYIPEDGSAAQSEINDNVRDLIQRINNQEHAKAAREDRPFREIKLSDPETVKRVNAAMSTMRLVDEDMREGYEVEGDFEGGSDVEDVEAPSGGSSKKPKKGKSGAESEGAESADDKDAADDLADNLGDDDDADDIAEENQNAARLRSFLNAMEAYTANPATHQKKLEDLHRALFNDDSTIDPEELSSLKADMIAKIIRDHLAKGIEGKILIFLNWSDSREAIYNALPEDIKSRTVNYLASAKEQHLAEFKNDPNKIALIGIQDSLSTGHNFQHASRLIRVQSKWTPGQLEQGDARILRPNLKAEDRRTAVYFDTVMCDGTIDIAKTCYLAAKQASLIHFEQSKAIDLSDREGRKTEATQNPFLQVSIGRLFKMSPRNIALKRSRSVVEQQYLSPLRKLEALIVRDNLDFETKNAKYLYNPEDLAAATAALARARAIVNDNLDKLDANWQNSAEILGIISKALADPHKYALRMVPLKVAPPIPGAALLDTIPYVPGMGAVTVRPRTHTKNGSTLETKPIEIIPYGQFLQEISWKAPRAAFRMYKMSDAEKESVRKDIDNRLYEVMTEIHHLSHSDPNSKHLFTACSATYVFLRNMLGKKSDEAGTKEVPTNPDKLTEVYYNISTEIRNTLKAEYLSALTVAMQKAGDKKHTDRSTGQSYVFYIHTEHLDAPLSSSIKTLTSTGANLTLPVPGTGATREFTVDSRHELLFAKMPLDAVTKDMVTQAQRLRNLIMQQSGLTKIIRTGLYDDVEVNATEAPASTTKTPVSTKTQRPVTPSVQPNAPQVQYEQITNIIVNGFPYLKPKNVDLIDRYKELADFERMPGYTLLTPNSVDDVRAVYSVLTDAGIKGKYFIPGGMIKATGLLAQCSSVARSEVLKVVGLHRFPAIKPSFIVRYTNPDAPKDGRQWAFIVPISTQNSSNAVSFLVPARDAGSQDLMKILVSKIPGLSIQNVSPSYVFFGDGADSVYSAVDDLVSNKLAEPSTKSNLDNYKQAMVDREVEPTDDLFAYRHLLNLNIGDVPKAAPKTISKTPVTRPTDTVPTAEAAKPTEKPSESKVKRIAVRMSVRNVNNLIVLRLDPSDEGCVNANGMEASEAILALKKREGLIRSKFNLFPGYKYVRVKSRNDLWKVFRGLQLLDEQTKSSKLEHPLYLEAIHELYKHWTNNPSVLEGVHERYSSMQIRDLSMAAPSTNDFSGEGIQDIAYIYPMVIPSTPSFTDREGNTFEGRTGEVRLCVAYRYPSGIKLGNVNTSKHVQFSLNILNRTAQSIGQSIKTSTHDMALGAVVTSTGALKSLVDAIKNDVNLSISPEDIKATEAEMRAIHYYASVKDEDKNSHLKWEGEKLDRKSPNTAVAHNPDVGAWENTNLAT